MTNDHFNRPLAALAQDRKDRKERPPRQFIGPPGQQKNVFLRVLRALRGSFFFSSSFLNRPLAALAQDRQDRKERRKDMFIGPPGQPKRLFFASFASFALFAVQSFLFEPPARCARSRPPRSQRMNFWPEGPTTICFSSRPS